MVKCPDCGVLWEKTSKAKNNRCPTCRPVYDKAWRARRKAEGKPVIPSAAPAGYHAAYTLRRSRDPKEIPKLAARSALRNAVAVGRITRGACARCGTTKLVEGHHPDYAKPLDVVWLCRPHHRELHQAESI